MLDSEWYEKTEDFLLAASLEQWPEVIAKAILAYQKLGVEPARTSSQVAALLDTLRDRILGKRMIPMYSVAVANDGPVDTPDDMVLEPAYNEIEVQRLWDLHDGRNDGMMVVAVYRWDNERGVWLRDTSWGLLGDEGAKRHADPDNVRDRLSNI